jgi:hypothetical protein
MKKKHVTSKLKLNKETIARLNNIAMQDVKAGQEATTDITDVCSYFGTDCTWCETFWVTCFNIISLLPGNPICTA